MFVYLVKKPKPNRPFSNEEWVSANAVSYAGYIQLKQGGKTLELLSGWEQQPFVCELYISWEKSSRVQQALTGKESYDGLVEERSLSLPLLNSVAVASH